MTTIQYERPATDDRVMWDILLSKYHLPALAVADELKLFASLKDGPRPWQEVASALGLSPRAVRAVFDLLAALQLVSAADGMYALTEASRAYLLPDSPFYWGPVLRSLGVVSTQHHALVRALTKTAAPLAAAATEGAQAWERRMSGAVNAWERREVTPEMAATLCRVMHRQSLPAAVALAERGGFDAVKSLLDVGGGSGCYSIAIAQRFFDVRCTIVEFPAVCAAAEGYIAEAGVGDRVCTTAADIFNDPWPPGHDAVLLSNVFHDWPEEANAILARAAFAALPSGGRIFVHEMLSEEGVGPSAIEAFSVVMLLLTRGRQYRFRELDDILRGAGFEAVEVRPTFGYFSVVSGRKP
jgi:acetylserotonin N-methyltransferase